MSPSLQSRTVLVIQPDEEDPLDLFDPILRWNDVASTVVRPFAGEPVPHQVEADGLIVLGGEMGANDDHDHPWLADIRHLLRAAVDEQVPTLGICLGGQLLAAACGGTVERGGSGMEVGAVPIDPRPEAADDALLGRISWPATFATMHQDVIVDLPADSVWLAESRMYPHQAFRLGPRAWGLQFHPEVSLDGFRRWGGAPGQDPETTRRIERGTAEFAERTRPIARAARQLATTFAGILHAPQDIASASTPQRPTR